MTNAFTSNAYATTAFLSNNYFQSNSYSVGSTGYTGSIGSTGYTGSIGTTLPFNPQSGTYLVRTSDNGSLISAVANVTVNTGIFTNGQNFSVFNNTSANITIIANTGVTFYLAGTSSTGNRILATRGLATLICVNTSTFVATGAGIS